MGLVWKIYPANTNPIALLDHAGQTGSEHLLRAQPHSPENACLFFETERSVFEMPILD